MATELFKETMKTIMNDYLDFARDLNKAGKEVMNPTSLKLSLLEYSQLYMDYSALAIDDYPEDDDLDYTEVEEDDKEEETY